MHMGNLIQGKQRHLPVQSQKRPGTRDTLVPFVSQPSDHFL